MGDCEEATLADQDIGFRLELVQSATEDLLQMGDRGRARKAVEYSTQYKFSDAS